LQSALAFVGLHSFTMTIPSWSAIFYKFYNARPL
jgi:hypothetical protein